MLNLPAFNHKSANYLFLYGINYIVPFIVCMAGIGFPVMMSTLYIGTRFQGHLNKLYMGFIGEFENITRKIILPNYTFIRK